MDPYSAVVSVISGALAAGLGAQWTRRRWERRVRADYDEAERRRMDETRRLVAVTLSEALLPYREKPAEPAPVKPAEEEALSDRQVIAELAHSLRTPLLAARHEADAIALSHPDLPDLVKQARNIEGFVDLCDNVLATFRQLVDTARRTERLRGGSLDEMVRRLHTAVESEHKRGTALVVMLPHGIPGYTTGYLATLLLPLIENAVEASTPHGSIRVKYNEEEDYSFLTVTNDIGDVADGPVFPDDGVSTKHEGPGLGLSVVRRLADMRRGGRVVTEVHDHVAYVRVRLPKERRS
ncbi:MAG: sensor histidine kinase [Solirubrobacterales bacterium]